MRLTVVGSAPAYAQRPGQASSCYLIESGVAGILLDLGQGSFAALSAYREPSSLRAIFISHLHPDHHIDLVPLRHYLRYACDPPRTVPLHPPADLRRRIDVLFGESDFLEPLPGEDLVAGTCEVAPFRVRMHPVKHALNSFSFRVTDLADEQSPGLTYSGDCGDADDLRELLQPRDAFLCEASWGAAETPPANGLHLTAAQAATVARDRGAARLVLTHVLDEFDPAGALEKARAIFDGPVDLAEPGMVVEIG